MILCAGFLAVLAVLFLFLLNDRLKGAETDADRAADPVTEAAAVLTAGTAAGCTDASAAVTAAGAAEEGSSPEMTAERPEERISPETAAEKSVGEASPETAEERSVDEASPETAAEKTEEETAPETEESTEENTEEATAEEAPVFLENLDAYRPKDVIPEEKIDRENLSKYFVSYKISREGSVFRRINGKSWQENNNIALSDLRYIQMPFYDFSGNVRLGEMIVNGAIADDVIAVFKELFLQKYQIEKMELIDNYWLGDGDSSDTNSVEHNNTSAFCYRTATDSGSLSRHAYGMAIDINPQQNPYVSYSSGKPEWSHGNANDYIARDTGLPHVITHEDAAFRLFQQYGFLWGGDWENPKDYQHFEMR